MVGQEILVLFIMVRIRAPQPKLTKCSSEHFFVWNTRVWQVRKFVLEFLCSYRHFRTFDFSGVYQHIYINADKFVSIPPTKNFRTGKNVRIATIIYPVLHYRSMWLWCVGEKTCFLEPF